MRRRVLHRGFAWLALSTLVAACGGRYSEKVEEDGPPDGGAVVDAASSKDGNVEPNFVDGSPPDTSLPDAADSASNPGPPAKLALVNATSNLGPAAQLDGSAALRLCFKVGMTASATIIAPLPPVPDKVRAGRTAPGIFHGEGRTLPGFGVDLEALVMVPILMNAKTLATKGFVNPGNGSSGTTCDELLGANADAAAGLVANVDYWEMPVVPAGTFKKSESYVAVVTGCAGNATIADTSRCGPGFVAGTGNLEVTVFGVTRAPASALSIGVQVIHASPPIGSVVPGFVASPTTGSNFRAAVPASGVTFRTVTSLRAVAGVTDGDSFVLAQTNPAAPPASLLPFSLPKIQFLSDLGPESAPTVYTANRNFVFIALGDPALAGTDPRSFRFIALPSDPAVMPYTP